MKKPSNVAIVCDWLTEIGGAERVILAVHQMYPGAPIFTSQYRPKRATWFAGADVRTGWLNFLPAKLRRFIPFLRQVYFSNLDLSNYDVVISITGAEAKGVKTHPEALHISYMHAPTQYYWTLYKQYIENPGFGWLNPFVRFGLKLLVGPLRRADYRAAQKPDVIVANSTYIQKEIKKHYNRESELLWPNVDIRRIQAIAHSKCRKKNKSKNSGYIVYGRQVSWKRMDLAVEAAIMMGENLLVIGDGPEHEKLVHMAAGHNNIEFLPRYDGIEEIVEYICSSKAFLFPSLEPFGIAPVEALAAGTPVIALKQGGALDFVDEGSNGIFFDKQTAKSMMSAMKRFDNMVFNKKTIARSVEAFSEESFKKRLRELISLSKLS